MNDLLQINIPGCNKRDKRYLARCLNELKRWKAPISGWVCVGTVDVRDDDPQDPLSECDLCGCTCVRYEHHMTHERFPFPVVVGCICAGVMEGNILRAKERERLVRNRAKRRDNFIKKKWERDSQGDYTRRYRKQDITIRQSEGEYTVQVDGICTKRHKGKPITNLLTASYAAFNMADPEVSRARENH